MALEIFGKSTGWHVSWLFCDFHLWNIGTALIFISFRWIAHLVGKVDIGPLIQAVQHTLPVVCTTCRLQAGVQVHRVPLHANKLLPATSFADPWHLVRYGSRCGSGSMDPYLSLTDPDADPGGPKTSVADPWHFGVDPGPDPDPRIHASD